MKYLKRLAIPCLLMGLSMSAISVVIPKINGAIAQDVKASSTPKGFIQFPSLISTNTSDRDTNTRNTIYSFQISVPAQAGASLSKVTITQKDPIEQISFFSDRTTAYIQEPSGDRITVETKTEIDPANKSVSVIFSKPIPAGKTVIVGLRPVSNPSLEGQYTFALSAFADNQASQGQTIGNGYLGFYNELVFNSFVPF